MTDETALLRRLARTVRVATHTALAEYELGRAGAAVRRVTFQALAAKTADTFRFPDAGLVSGDGLVSAHLDRDAEGKPAGLILQAQGSAGLSAYAGRTATVTFGPLGPEADASFDADGRAVVDLAAHALSEDDLAGFELTVPDAP